MPASLRSRQADANCLVGLGTCASHQRCASSPTAGGLCSKSRRRRSKPGAVGQVSRPGCAHHHAGQGGAGGLQLSRAWQGRGGAVLLATEVCSGAVAQGLVGVQHQAGVAGAGPAGGAAACVLLQVSRSRTRCQCVLGLLMCVCVVCGQRTCPEARPDPNFPQQPWNQADNHSGFMIIIIIIT